MRRSNRLTEPARRALGCGLRRIRGERGSASLEFITAGLILLLPLVYLVLTMSSIQAAALATEGAARQAARVFVLAGTERDARGYAERAIRVGLADYGIDADAARVNISCAPRPDACLTRLGTVTVTVEVMVALPLVPQALDLATPASIPMQGAAAQTVSRFWSAG